MKRPSAIERAIAKLDADIAVLEAAKKRLQQEQAQAVQRKPRIVKAPSVGQAG